MRKITCVSLGIGLLLTTPSITAAAASPSRLVDTHRCSAKRDYCIVVQYNTSTHRLPLVIAHKVSGVEGHTYWARWSHKQPGKSTKTSAWKKSSWTGDNGRAPGVAVETIWGRKGRAGGPKLARGTVVCTQFKGSGTKACHTLG